MLVVILQLLSLCCRRRKPTYNVRLAVGYRELQPAVLDNVAAVRCDCRGLARQGWGTHDGRALESLLFILSDDYFRESLSWFKHCILRAATLSAGNSRTLVVEAFCRSGLHRSVGMVTIVKVLLEIDGFESKWDADVSLDWRTWKSPCSCPECNRIWTPVSLERELGPARWAKLKQDWGLPLVLPS